MHNTVRLSEDDHLKTLENKYGDLKKRFKEYCSEVVAGNDGNFSFPAIKCCFGLCCRARR